MIILSIETSADETAAAVTQGRRRLSSLLYSQVLLYKQWGGIVPSIAKRAHEERIDQIIVGAVKRAHLNANFDQAMKKIDAIGVTYGPGLAIALEVGINKAKELARKYQIRLIAVNHLEGHIYANFIQNRRGMPPRRFTFPYLALLVSGGHTAIVIFRRHLDYQVIGETKDDAVGEALDKAARILGFGYPGGPIIENLADEVDNQDKYLFPRPMARSDNFNFSYSGLKTAFFYRVRKMSEKEKLANLRYLASSFQEAAFDSLIIKLEKAIKKTKINRILVGGGVSANFYLRKKIRSLVKKYQGRAFFPPQRDFSGDNAAMIGVVAYFKARQNQYVENIDRLDRQPRLAIGEFNT